jgi:hypothetical protein
MKPEIHFNIILLSTLRSAYMSVSFWLSHLPIRATCPAHFTLPHLIILIILREEYKL